MWQRISRSKLFLAPAICAVALAACSQNPRPEGAITPAGNYGGTVVAYPVGDMYGYGSPFDYGYYGLSPYAIGGYGYSPYAYGYYGYPGAVVYGPPIIRGYRSPLAGRITTNPYGTYGLQPWSQGHRIAVPRPSQPSTVPLAQRSFAPPPRVYSAPPRHAQPRAQSRHH